MRLHVCTDLCTLAYVHVQFIMCVIQYYRPMTSYTKGAARAVSTTYYRA